VASGENGMGGLDGNPGFSSGSLSIFAERFVNECSLIVETTGGNGGDGQDGGDGKEGELVDADAEIQERNYPVGLFVFVCFCLFTLAIATKILLGNPAVRRNAHFVRKICATFLFVGAFTAYALKTKYASRVSRLETCLQGRGTLGGPGGREGAGASAGLVRIFVQNGDCKSIHVTRTKGSNGNAGSMGKHGENLLKNLDEEKYIKNLVGTLGIKKRLQKRSQRTTFGHIPNYKYDKVNVPAEIIKFIAEEVVEDRNSKDFLKYISEVI
jgi:hypothetical protein